MKITSIRRMKGGYTLLFAVLTAALVLGVAVFILSVSTKQYELSASARNSIYSFYAADAGIECASAAYSSVPNGGVSNYIDSATGASVTCGVTTGTSPQTVTVGPFGSGCLGYPSFLVPSSVTCPSATLNFTFQNSGTSPTCADVMMYDGLDSSGVHYMIFDSRGYNHCTSSGGPDTTNSATVERALRLTKKG